ncbi:Inorganic pyrophosphatase [Kluyvera cryocrescens]|uniref:inorganic diphosphatase n=1 Tax=Kluyvera cryocrescens TaxID=580 RepID=A0A485CT23_KLUCR|nr:Inorganic pyrophosphatase [Kluyvera cryocrescens]
MATPLDVVFYTRAPMAPGTLIKLRAIGVLKMVDGGEKDDKIIAVPASKIDPTYDEIKNISDLPKIEQERLEAFFRVYKQLPAGRKSVELIAVSTMPLRQNRKSNRPGMRGKENTRQPQL